MLGLLISPLIVMFLLWLLARNEAELSYYIIFFVVAGVSILAFLATFASPWLGIAVYLIGLPFAIARFRAITRGFLRPLTVRLQGRDR